MAKRKFQVIGHLDLKGFPLYFTTTGGLKFRQPGHRSLRAATKEAVALAESGWFSTIIRRVPGGWVAVVGYDPIRSWDKEPAIKLVVH